MAVRVRLFAALREAAGRDEAEAEPGPLPVVLDSLCERYGERFAAVLKIASVLLDGTQVARDADVEVADGSEIALLPPVSGGARSADRWPPREGQDAPAETGDDERPPPPAQPPRPRVSPRDTWPPRAQGPASAGAPPARPPAPRYEHGQARELPADWESRNETMDFPLPPATEGLSAPAEGGPSLPPPPLPHAEPPRDSTPDATDDSGGPWSSPPGKRAPGVGWSPADPGSGPAAGEQPQREPTLQFPATTENGSQVPTTILRRPSPRPKAEDGQGPTSKLHLDSAGDNEQSDPPAEAGAQAGEPSGETSMTASRRSRRAAGGKRRDRQTLRGGHVKVRAAMALRSLPKDPVAAAAPPIALTIAGLAGLLAGPDALAFTVLIGTVLAVADLVVLIDRGIARPLLPVVAVMGLVLPAAVALDVSIGWDAVASFVAFSVLAAFGLMVVRGRRWGVIDGLGMTLLAGLVTGLGASALILLRGLPQGLRVVAMLAALVVVADLAMILARLAGASPQLLYGVPVMAAAPVALLFVLVPGGPSLLVMLLLVISAVAGVLNGRALTAALRWEGRLEPRPAFLPKGLIGDGVIFSAVDALLIAAPVAYVALAASG